MKDYGLVSIIMASYNSEKWIAETIECVQSQTYKNWELLITDDNSSDKTVEIIKQYENDDNRIRHWVNSENKGSGPTRNNSLANATGVFISYLDSDDLWTIDKLEKQLDFMNNNSYAMCYTSYDLINEIGEYKKTVKVPDKITYDKFLKGPLTCTHSICFDVNIISKKLLNMPNVRKGQDSATWLQVLKTGVVGYGMRESLAKYRRHKGSLSNNKLKALKRTWFLYRGIEKLSFPYACVCFISYVVNALKKYY